MVVQVFHVFHTWVLFLFFLQENKNDLEFRTLDDYVV